MKIKLMFGIFFCGVFTACHLRARTKLVEKINFHDNLNYSANGDKDAGFDLYTPRLATEKTPLAIFIHGGYWRNQTRSYYQIFTGLYQNVGLALASRGIATAVIDYPLHPKATIEDQLNHIASAVSYLKTHADQYAIDPAKIFLVGHSAGGHLALLTLWKRKNPDVRAVVALSPILDIAHMRQNKDDAFNRELTTPFFGQGENDAKYSPATYFDKNSGAALILIGEKDYPYLIEQGNKYLQKFAQEDLKQIRFERVPQADHSGMVLQIHTSDDKVSDTIARYIKQMAESK